MKYLVATLIKAFRNPIVVERILFHCYRNHVRHIKNELHTKIQRAKYDYLMIGLKYLFCFYQSGLYPSPWEAKTFQIHFERTNYNYNYGQTLSNGKYFIKINVGPAYFYLSDNLFYR